MNGKAVLMDHLPEDSHSSDRGQSSAEENPANNSYCGPRGSRLASPFPSQHNGPDEVGVTKEWGRGRQAYLGGSRFYF